MARHFAEIDLLRGGVGILAREMLPPYDYLVHVSQKERCPKGLIWPILFSQRLPVVPIPMRPSTFRQIVHACGDGGGAVQRKLKLLAGVGIIRRRVSGRQLYFQAKEACPVFEELKGLMLDRRLG